MLEADEGITNLSLYCNHITIIPTIKAILDEPDMAFDGFVGPGHVSMVIGLEPYGFVAEQYRRPVVVTGFEPIDVLTGIWMLVKRRKRRGFSDQVRSTEPGDLLAIRSMPFAERSASILGAASACRKVLARSASRGVDASAASNSIWMSSSAGSVPASTASGAVVAST